jgi:hypothetical protein
MRTNRAGVALKVTVSVPPLPAVWFATVFQLWPSPDTSMRYDTAWAFSQSSTTLFTLCALPRSTAIHCGSENADDQRVSVRPSLTLAALKATAFSVLLAVTGRWSARLVEAVWAKAHGAASAPARR